jgi:SAM-dependent methyltransferase
MSEPSTNPVVSQSMEKARFDDLYEGKAPWDIGRPQPTLVSIAEQVSGPVLDAGCGTGEHALFFAARGHHAVGIDFLEKAIDRARAKARERGVKVQFLVKDATALEGWDQRFMSVIDCGLFHCFSDDDRRRYVRGLAHVLEPGGRLFLLSFSDEEPGTDGPRRVTRQEVHDSFAEGFEVESLSPIQIEVNAAAAPGRFSEGGPKGWLAIVRRKG